MPKLCYINGCDTPVFSRGYCMYHYRQMRAREQSLAQTDAKIAKPFKVGDYGTITVIHPETGKPIKCSVRIASIKKTPIKKVSDKQAKRLAKYRIARDEYFKDHPVCEFPDCTSLNISLHHAAGKIGNLLFDKKYFRSLCWEHHEYCERHPIVAQALGLSFKRLDK